MAKPTLEEIKAAADEYVKLSRRIATVETARERAMAPVIERHAKEVAEATGSFDKRIEKLERQAAEKRAFVKAFLAGRTRTFADQGEISEFGVMVGSKPGTRVPDREKLRKLCREKGVDYDAITTVLLGEADKALGVTAVTEISERPSVPTRDEYLRPKQ